jgi:CRISPR-associated endonuclease/helicase Cas3
MRTFSCRAFIEALMGADMADFFAHTGLKDDHSDWHALVQHLRAVADLAEERAAKFGAGPLGRICGLLHDLGKYSPEFQARLRGAKTRVDHSTAGARLAARKHAQFGKLLAYVIAGHHAGLANGTGDGEPTPLKSRLDAKHGIPDCGGWQKELVVPDQMTWTPPAPHPDPEVRRNRRGHCLSLLTRMLFSALVDADRLDTEGFCAKRDGEPVLRGNWQPLNALKEQLDRFMGETSANAKPTPVNWERAKILAAARAKAGLEPGLFSLTVPTGGGKTLASLTFALDHAVRHGLDRVIYVIPFTSIIEQTAGVFRDALRPLSDHVLEHHSAFREDEALAALERIAGGRDESSLQSGERLRFAAENWDVPIVVTTAVQFFESLFSNRPGKCRKLHNIAKSVVILDEAQTLPLNLLRPCVAVLDELARNYKTSIVLCTATQPALGAVRPGGGEGLAGGLIGVREIIDEPRELYEKMKRVRVDPVVAKLDDASLAERVRQREQVLCIVGTRTHARELYQMVRHEQPAGTFHLSALMCPAHRSAKLAEIKQALKAGPCRVVATTVIEAGVDVDFPVVYRIMAGLDSIAQAAGRCNREGTRAWEDSLVQLFEIEGRKPIQALAANEDAAREVLRRPGIDPLGLDAIKAYFQRLYWGRMQGRDDGLDAKDIVARLNVQAHEGWIPFADVARDFRMIDSAMEPVIIPYDDKARQLLAELETAERPGGLARKLQPYIVNVPRDAFAKLRGVGRVVPVQEYRFQDQFMRLTDEARQELYRDDLGFDWSDATFRSVEKSIF